MREVGELVKQRATPWVMRYGLTMEELRTTRDAEGWHIRCAGALSGGAGSGARGDET